MNNAKYIGISMSPFTSLEEDKDRKKVDEAIYRGMIGSLLYLTASRPDIMLSAYKCARFQSAPKESHLSVVKYIIRYLMGTSNFGFWYPLSNNFDLKGFSYANFAGDKSDRQSRSATSQMLSNALVSWRRKKQNCFALSITEVEYLVVEDHSDFKTVTLDLFPHRLVYQSTPSLPQQIS